MIYDEGCHREFSPFDVIFVGLGCLRSIRYWSTVRVTELVFSTAQGDGSVSLSCSVRIGEFGEPFNSSRFVLEA